MKKQKFQIGQKVTVEGVECEDIFFVESGEFEITKALYLHKARSSTYYEYLRITSTRDSKFLQKIFDPDTKVLFSSNENEFDDFRHTCKRNLKKMTRISSIGENECFGLIEGILECPYAIATIT